MLNTSAALIGGLLYSQAAQQIPFTTSFQTSVQVQGPFAPLGNLSLLAQDSFSVLEHPEIPDYSIRIKKSQICDGLVDAYTGYLDAGSRHSFFWFFESRQQPENDDVIFWTSGGPGGSSARGVFMEIGPCRVLEDGKTVIHEESWVSNANLFFMDLPAAVGFSYSDDSKEVVPVETVALDVNAFLIIFFEHFTIFKGLPFHFAADSYASSYLPAFATTLLDQNLQLEAEKRPLTPINLSSLILGNAMTDFYTMIPGYYKMACTSTSGLKLLDAQTCMQMRQALPRCQKAAQEACIRTTNATKCEKASNDCVEQVFEPFWTYGKGRNPYNVKTNCKNGDPDSCPTFILAPFASQVVKHLNQPELREQLRIDPVFESYKWDNLEDNEFRNQLDLYHDTFFYITALLERNVRILSYVGKDDFVCNWLGNEKWTRGFEWYGRKDFRRQPMRKWKVNGHLAGKARKAEDGALMFTVIDDAGHVVPRDKPKELLELIKKWMKHEDL
ncbi:serine carboxypeptidase [Crepidotus variabilis]|uniref:carboxypeptidase C n=1 Tax=Crepidotus variabilis TaxID=179855 RepID=A0A9P6EFL2_9AGAR|nr:serine carboxypeptidase [Crepidotus variabilis]